MSFRWICLVVVPLCLAGGCTTCGSEESRSPAPEIAAPPTSPATPRSRPELSQEYAPLAAARDAGEGAYNRESGVPPMCYTRTDGISNPCWVCHTLPAPPNGRDDRSLQAAYAFSDEALTNHWTNLFGDRTAAASTFSDAEILEYIRQDNLRPLVDYLRDAPEDRYGGYRPDLDFDRGFDELGFAVDGTGWRALRYKPFPGTFWPTNGSSDDVFIRLPAQFRQDASGQESLAIYRINLSILEAAITADPFAGTSSLRRIVEPLDETAAGVDLDGDGQITDNVTAITGLPAHYVGRAAAVSVTRGQHPEMTEYLHSVRYVDPDAPDLRSRRIKELRYARHVEVPSDQDIARAYSEDQDERELGRIPRYRGTPETGLLNAFGWQFQGWIEDSEGRLRLQTMEEHRFCMGCHTGIGVTVDSTFSLARKVPGLDGWRVQTLVGMPDVPQSGHADPEALTYFRRVRGADELRANTEMLERFWAEGELNEAEVRRAAPGGDRDLAWLFTPSRQRALDLARAYRVIVREQSFTRGRDPLMRPAEHVHREITNGNTELGRSGLLFSDGRLTLSWPAP